ncbi:testis-specific serine/threonine-protein kinase 6 [Astyanax mexicanus]|uniref:testis-specific serine/threonine-protein kinase 6 n=1 Tax=Astyanax mexicanus TaxID=7994 RepID=UPI0020CB0EB0|nr:testis-specific serine/threonine-protein kinase 6 [Astyanax mexicanus]
METDEALRDLGYEVLRDLDGGDFSTVKLAKSKKYQKTVALKIMQIDKHVQKEVSILKRVKHPHIISVLDIFEMAGRLVCIVMEAAPSDLEKAKKFQSVIPTDQARTWFSQLVSAVVYLHKQNIAHRDLKCENVLLTADNQVKLIDFGFGRFSRGFPDLTREFCCTPAYAAPEVLLKRPYDPKKADVWSLGVILYWMVVGRLPFQNWFDFPGCQRKPIYFPERLEEPCRDLISYMLRYNYLMRPSAKKVAQHPWLQMKRELSENVERPIPRALLQRMKRFFKRSSSAEAPTCFCSTENVLPHPAIKEETKRHKFKVQFKIPRKKKKNYDV